eukprot:6472237-Amphidinium_carterae.4
MVLPGRGQIAMWLELLDLKFYKPINGPAFTTTKQHVLSASTALPSTTRSCTRQLGTWKAGVSLVSRVWCAPQRAHWGRALLRPEEATRQHVY